MLTNETLEETYGALRAAMVVAFDAGDELAVATNVVESNRAILLLNGRLDGKNEAIREAQTREILFDEYQRLQTAEATNRRAKNNLDLARLDVELARAKLRLMEIAATAEVV